MSKSVQDTGSETRLPGVIVGLTVALCILPVILNLAGVDFGRGVQQIAPPELEGVATHQLINQTRQFLAGSFIHSILEWTAFCTALFIVILTFIHFRITQDVVTPLIGIALFWAGCMDAFHALLADQLVAAVADNANLVLFTWAISRMFTAIILTSGALLLLVRWPTLQDDQGAWSGLRFIMSWSAVIGLVAIGLIYYSTTSSNLPQATFPEAIVKHPYDIVPLVLYLIAGMYIFPELYRRHPSVFSHSLMICVIPLIAVQFYMAYGSTALYDNYFNIAHALKILAYFIPFLGLALDYVRVYRRQRETALQLELEINVRRRIESEQRLSEERYMLALSGAELGTWDWNALTGEVQYNERWARMLGYRLDELKPDVETWEGLLHPDDLSRATEALICHLDGKTDFYESEHRLRSKSGDWVWVLDKGKVINRDDTGRPVRVVGTHLDITERKLAEMELRESHRLMSTALATAGKVQRGMLPAQTELDELYRETSWRIAYFSQSCQHLGGDFFGLRLNGSGEILLYLVDLSGHGIPVSLSAIGLQTHITHVLEGTSDPLLVFKSANLFCIEQLPEEIYATMVFCRIDTATGRVEGINAGHQPVIMIDRENRSHLFESSAPALGMFSNADEYAGKIELDCCRHCRMVVYSDGVTDMRSPSASFYGDDRLVQDVQDAGSGSPDDLIGHMRSRLFNWRGRGRPLEDDVTLVAVQWDPPISLSKEQN